MRNYSRRGLDWSSKAVRAEYQRDWQKAHKKPPPFKTLKARPEAIECSKCKVLKPFTEKHFYPQEGCLWGLQKQCRECAKKHWPAWKWGLSPEVYDTYVRNGSCHICGRTTTGMSLDHCHKSGNPRGVLCRRCNTGLGVFKDNPALLEAAAAYLRKAQ